MLSRTLFVAIASGLVAFVTAFLLSVPSRTGAVDEPASPPGPETVAERATLEKLVAEGLPEVVDEAPSVTASVLPIRSPASATASRAAPLWESAKARDAEWDSFPRPKWSFASHVRWGPQRIGAADLYRHPELNPLDRYIPPAVRETLDALVQAYRPRLANVHALYTKTSFKEFDAAVAKGLGERSSVRVPMREGRFAVQLPDGFHNGVVRVDARGATLVDRKHLPVTTKVLEYRRFLALELGGHIVNWFERMGLCPSKQASELLSQIAAPIK